MLNLNNKMSKFQILVDGQDIQHSNKFVYLGANVSAEDRSERYHQKDRTSLKLEVFFRC